MLCGVWRVVCEELDLQLREELLSPSEEPEDTIALLDEPGLRPKTLDEFVGQAELKGHLSVMLGAAARRRRSGRSPPVRRPRPRSRQDHARQHHRRGDGNESPGHVGSSARTGWRSGIDPVKARGRRRCSSISDYRLPRPVEEVLYPAQRTSIDVVLGKGPAARSIPLDLARFTLVGATTRTGLITGPLRDRFGLLAARLDYYEVDDLQVDQAAQAADPRGRHR